MTEQNEELLLTNEEIKDFILSMGWILSPVKMTDLVCQYKAFLAKARPIIEKQERERISHTILKYSKEHGNEQLAWVLESENFWQALKGEK